MDIPVLHSDGSSGQVGRALTGVDAEIAESLKRFIEDREAYSERTWSQLQYVFRAWGRWCWERGYPLLPIHHSHMREYVFHLATKYSVNSVTLHMSLLAMIQQQAQLVPANIHPDVKRAMKKVRRQFAEAGQFTGQAIPISIDDLRMIARTWQDSDKLVDARNLAFLVVSYHTLLRISELSRLKVKDFQPLSNGMATLFIGRTKTNLTGSGTVKALGKWATSIVNSWLQKSGLDKHPDAILFPPIHRSGKARVTTTPMTTKYMEIIFSEAWFAINDEPADPENGRYTTWTGHSARVGAAVDMAERGVSLPEIMREGGWRKPETVLRYIRRKEAFSSAMLDITDDDDA
ncbi:tyrosine-type recombinase/integrase [Escherichia coli]|nr:tyrosine-type recombinase/integrase [Escherichia coli]